MGTWTQESALRLKYKPQLDPKEHGDHFLWEGRSGFGMRLYRSGRRTWQQCGTVTKSGKQVPRFFTLGVVGEMSLKEARVEASKLHIAMREGIDPREQIREGHRADKEQDDLASTSLRSALDYYDKNRNCAPSSKVVLRSCLETNLSAWMSRPLLSIDTTMLQTRYREIIERVKSEGEVLEARYASLASEERLLRAPSGYRTGIKTANDTIEGFGRVYTYWTTKHAGMLQKAGVVVPVCPTAALNDDLLPLPQRVKGVPTKDLRVLIQNLPSYQGNALHPLLARFLLATGLRVGVAMNCKPEYVKHDRIVIPASAARAKVRWNKRHLEHMAKIVPITPEIRQILSELKRVAPTYGRSEQWLFPSATSKSGHMEEEKAAALALRKHAKVRFTFHQFRHNVATVAEELGYSKTEIAELLGQATGSVTDRYIDERVKRHHLQLSAINSKLQQSIKPDGRSFGTMHAPKATHRRGKKPRHTQQPSLPGL